MWVEPGIRDFPVFLLSAVMLALTPGQDTLYVLGRTIAQGRAAGIASIAGILSGALVHLVAGAVGLSALLAAYPAAFTVVKWMGGSYLVYLGIRMLLRRGSHDEAPDDFGRRNAAAIWKQGLVTNVLNPKVALFCLAFIPQFIRADAPHKAFAFLFLGFCFFIIGGAWLWAIVLFSGAIGKKLKGNPKLAGWLDRASGALFIGLGLRMILQRL